MAILAYLRHYYLVAILVIPNRVIGVLMQAQKLSISLPQEQYRFIEHYQAEHCYKTRFIRTNAPGVLLPRSKPRNQ